MQVTNTAGVSLPMAVWLLHDDYDMVYGVDNYMSVTTLMKPLRQIVLPRRIPPEENIVDVQDFIARKMGHSLHDSIEKAWLNPERALKLLGFSDAIIARIKINPTDDERRAMPDMIPVFLEQRAMAQIDAFTIGGKFDMVSDGIVNDSKSTSVWGWVKGTRDDDHITQMSLYRWIDAQQPMPKIDQDFGRVNYIFTDWAKMMARSTPGYPDSRVKHKDYPLWSLDETEAWVRAKLALIQANWNTPEDRLPECTDIELWRSAPQFKYFSDPAKAQDPTARSTKNFDSLSDANKFMAEKGGRGIVITKPGEVKACAYCAAFNGCTQKDRYL